MDQQQLARAIIAKTREGRVQDWNERIAALVQQAGMDTASINWNAAPNIVALSVAGTIPRIQAEDLEALL